MAVRGRGDIWNRDALPVTDWEDPHQRVVVPTVLRKSLRHPVPDVLRWEREKYRSVTNKDARDPPVIVELTRHLAHWGYHGEERGDHAGNHASCFRMPAVDGVPCVSVHWRAAITSSPLWAVQYEVSGRSALGNGQRRKAGNVTFGLGGRPGVSACRAGAAGWEAVSRHEDHRSFIISLSRSTLGKRSLGETGIVMEKIAMMQADDSAMRECGDHCVITLFRRLPR